METKQRRKTYSREFKQEAVRLVRESDQSLAAVARDLGIDGNSLRKWQRAEMQHGEQAFPGKGRSHDEELACLQREVALLRQERDILKRPWGTLQPPRAETPFCQGAPKSLAGVRDVPRAAGSSKRLLSLAVELRGAEPRGAEPLVERADRGVVQGIQRSLWFSALTA